MSLESDFVAVNLLGSKLEYIVKGLNQTDKPHEINASIDAILRHLGRNRYLEELKRELTAAIKDSAKKKNIIKLTRLLVSELLNLGYEKEFIYYSLMDVFCNPEKKVTVHDDVFKFLNLFDGKIQKYKVYRLVHKDIRFIKKIADKFDVVLEEEFKLSEESKIAEKMFFSYKKANEVIFNGTFNALDPFHAAGRSANLLSIISNVVGFYSHHKKLRWNKYALVTCNNGNIYTVNPSIHLMETRPNKKADDVLKFSAISLSGYGLKEESAKRVLKVMSLHGASMRTDSTSSQLLNLWSAIEALFPVPKGEESRINYIMSCLIPILRRVYIRNLFEELFIEISKSIPDLKLDGLIGENNLEKFVGLVCLDEYSEQRKERLYNILWDENPLATNRIYELNKQFKESRLISKLLKKHEQKIEWQIHRIYRCRNEIIHSGDYQLPFLKILIENLHYYVDTIIEYIQKIIESGMGSFNFEDIVYDTRIEINVHDDLLEKEKGKSITVHNYIKLILG